MSTQNQELITVRHAAKHAGVTDATVRRWIHDGYLKAFRTSTGTWRIEPRVLNQFLFSEPKKEQSDVSK